MHFGVIAGVGSAVINYFILKERMSKTDYPRGYSIRLLETENS